MAILLALDDYHLLTSIRFKYYDPATDPDYVYITAEESGCWSYVGRQGGVSNTLQGAIMIPNIANLTVRV
jgi:hypothetical protein